MSKYWRSPWPRGLASNKSFKSLPCLYLSGLHGGARKLKWPRFGFMPKKRMKFGREWHCTTLKKMDSDLTCISNYWRSPCPRGLASNKSFKSLPCQVFTEELGNWNGHDLGINPMSREVSTLSRSTITTSSTPAFYYYAHKLTIASLKKKILFSTLLSSKV